MSASRVRRFLRGQLLQLRRSRRYAILLGLLVALPVLLLQVAPEGVRGDLLTRLDYLLYDARYTLTLGEHAAGDHRIVVIDIDERSLAVEGRWPWSRFKMTQLLDKLAAQGVVVVGFDIVFSEPERNPVDVLEQGVAVAGGESDLHQKLVGLRPAFDADAKFASVLHATDVVLAYYLHTETPLRVGELPPPVLRLNGGADSLPTMAETVGYTTSLPILQAVAAGQGFVSADPDEDGVVRRSPLLLQYHGDLYPSFALEMARVYLVRPDVKVQMHTGSGRQFVSGVQVTDRPIRTDAAGKVIVPYRGGRRHFLYVSATDVLNDRVNPDALFNTIAVVGTSAVGLADLRATPLDKNYPGVEVHVSILDAILNGDFPYRPDWEVGATTSLLALLAVSCSLLFPFLGPAWLAITGSLLIAGLVSANFHLWQVARMDLPLAAVLLMVLVIMVTNLGLGYLRETTQRRQIKGMFDQYVPPAHIEEMLLGNHGADSLKGETREMTVIFSDVRGFTSISEKLTAGEIKELLETYLTPVTEVIFEYHGTVDKYVGDMVMAFWGAPLDNPNHGRDALGAALRMLEVTREVSAELIARGWPGISIGIGVNSGLMSVGDMGSRYRRAYTVLGDAVNLASRLEGLTRMYGVDLIVGDGTRNAVADFEWRLLDRIRVRGKDQVVRIWEPLGEMGTVGDEKLAAVARYKVALDLYFAQNWEAASMQFQQNRAAAPDAEERALCEVFLARIDILSREGVEANWDGAFRHTEK